MAQRSFEPIYISPRRRLAISILRSRGGTQADTGTGQWTAPAFAYGKRAHYCQFRVRPGLAGERSNSALYPI